MRRSTDQPVPASTDMTATQGADGTVVVRVAGEHRSAASLRVPPAVEAAIHAASGRVILDASALAGWDTSLLVLVQRIVAVASERKLEIDTSSLPDGLRRLLALSQSVPAQHPPAEPSPGGFIERVGAAGVELLATAVRVLSFVGELAYSFVRLATGKARIRRIDVMVELEGAGVKSLGIVGIVSFLLGMILAFVGGVTLRPFGATIYVANVVTVAMLRELGAVMTGIVMAGRTGSAYAAQLGTMKVTQEIDALTTMAVPTSDFLVLPRVIALSLMMPLLTIYADFIAVTGGGLVAVMSGAGPIEYLKQVQIAASLTTFWIGVAKSVVFGVIVAVCGCIQGLRADGGAASVGNAATSAVVNSIVWIIAIDGLFAVVLNVMGI